jgi:metallo-beta-lactamase class B
MKLPAPPPGKAFDNLAFVGSKWVSSWALVTSEGLLLVDAMDNLGEAEDMVDAGLRKLGLAPETIKTVIITHGHGDHYGGFDFFKSRYGSRAAMGAPDWDMVESTLDFDIPAWGRPPKRDIVLSDGDTVKLGQTSVEIRATPGHTMGTISLLFDVIDQGTVRRALLWGGTSFNFNRRADRMTRIAAYVDSTQRMKKIADEQNVEVFISNHTSFDDAVGKLAKNKPSGPNPFVIGREATQRALTIMNECALATQETWKNE